MAYQVQLKSVSYHGQRRQMILWSVASLRMKNLNWSSVKSHLQFDLFSYVPVFDARAGCIHPLV